MKTPAARIRPLVSDPAIVARKAVQNPAWLERIFEGLHADEARVRFGCAKALRLISAKRPDLLYPHFDFFVRLLNHDNKIFQWEAILVLSELARVDAGDKLAAILDKYFAPIQGPVMITAANAIRGGGRIGLARPHLADRIAGKILKVSRARFQTRECRNVAIGHAILALGQLFDSLKDPTPALRFVRRQVSNPRPATRKKAEQFLKRTRG